METSVIPALNQRHAVNDASNVAEVRRQGLTLARDINFSEEAAGRLALVLTELATNLLKHGGGGEILLCRCRRTAAGAVAGAGTGAAAAKADVPGIEVLALDRGPGMANVQACLRDGHSTAGSLGVGLGAIIRQAGFFDIYSRPDKGTAILAVVWGERPALGATAELGGALSQSAPAAARGARGFAFGAVALPKIGQQVSGDAWATRRVGASTQVLVVDGLGYGPHAASTAAAALRAFHAATSDAPAEILEQIHQALKSTRGAVGALASIRPAAGEVAYAGVGNIGGLLTGGTAPRHLLSYDGTLGYQARVFRETVYPWAPDTGMAMYSDGLSTRLSTEAYPALMQHHATLIAGLLYRDFHRPADDMTVVVVKGD